MTMFKIAYAAIAFAVVAAGTAQARPYQSSTQFDGSWHLTFSTRSPACDPSYDFNVNIVNGVITHPNLVKFHGTVSPAGAVRASVVVQDKSASGSGRLSASRGGGTWSGRSGSAACRGQWTAERS